MPDIDSSNVYGEVTAPVEIHAEIQTGPTIEVDVIGSGPIGPQGIQGPPGADGADGVSPVISSESITGGNRLTIVDAGGTTTVDVMDGQDGQDGQDGTNGTDGQDGVSPEVTIAAITGGHSVTITDKDHPGGQTFIVMDGQDGAGVPTGGSTGQVLTKKTGTDYDTEWTTPGTGSTDIFWCTYGSTSSADIETALAANKLPCVVRDDTVYVYGFKTSATKHYFSSTCLQSQQYLYIAEDNGSWAHNYINIRSIPAGGSAGQILKKNSGTDYDAGWSDLPHGVPSGGNAGQLLAKNSATDYDVHWVNKTQDYPSAYCTTAAGTAAKKASCSLWVDTANSYLHILIGQANTSASAITLNVNSTGAKPIYINGAASSATNYTLPAGSYIAFYDGTNYYFRTDGKLTANITGNAANGGVTSVNGQTGAVVLDADDVGALPDSYPTDWVLAGASSNSSTLVTYPATAIELFIKGLSTNSNAPIYCMTVPVFAVSDVKVIEVGGYYSTSSDNGLANVTHDPENRTIKFRNMKFGSATLTGTYYIYYR